jgi:hypothetical protein
MFNDMIHDLESRGHEIIITCRPLANTIDLLKQKNLDFTVVGEHYGKNFYRKIFGYPIRVSQLYKFLKNQHPDLAVSQSSFHSPVVASLLGIPSIYTNDNEHAMGNMPAFFFASKVLIPENLPAENVAKKGASRKKIVHYPGVKEGIYLWKKGEYIHESRRHADGKVPRVYIRPEPLTAQYYKGGLNFLDHTIEKIQDKVQVIILPRDKTQFAHYKQAKFKSVCVPEKPLEFDDIAKDCTLFIGAGGSMTREMAILGIPTISVYQDDLLEVDKFLLEEGIMKHEPELNPDTIMSFLKTLENKNPDLNLMIKGRKAYELFLDQIASFDPSRKSVKPVARQLVPQQ